MPAAGRISYEVRGLKSSTVLRLKNFERSHLIRGAWIEIMKADQIQLFILSHLIRGAWIEILYSSTDRFFRVGRISYEVRGLKSHICRQEGDCNRRISYEVRGLKFFVCLAHAECGQSHLIRGAWIEICGKHL